jgi:NDP-sugar pyrophosphorylase family protein
LSLVLELQGSRTKGSAIKETALYALTLVGGRGERLKPITDTLPKSMVPLNGRPIAEYQVRWMRSQGVTDVVFLTGYLGEKVEEHFGDGSAFGIRAHYSHEDAPLGRGGAIKHGISLVPVDENPILVTNGDNVTDLDLGQFMERHHATGALATLMLTRYPSQFGVVDVGDDDLIDGFVEKGMLPIWINAGVYLFDRAIEPLLPEIGDHETSTFQELVAQRKLASLRSNAMWVTVDGPKELREVSDRLIAAGLA